MKDYFRCAFITMLSLLILAAITGSAAYAGDGAGVPLTGERSAYFRMETVSGADEGPDKNRKRLLVELYDVKELPPVADLEGYPDIKKELKSYIRLGYKYIKLEVTTVNGRKSKKMEIYRGGGGAAGEKAPGS